MNLPLVKSLFKKYYKNTFLITFSQIVGFIVNLVALPIILSRLSLEDYGTFQFALAIQTWLLLLTVGNITLGSKKGIAQNKDGTFLFAFFYRTKFFIAITLLSLAISTIFFFFQKNTLGIISIIISSYTLFGYLPQVSYAEFLVGKNDFKSFSIWQTISAIIIPVVSAISAILTKNIFVFATVQLGATIIINISAFIYVAIRYNLYKSYKNKETNTDCIKYGLRMIPAEILLGTSNQLSNFIIGPFFGLSSLAVFSIANKIDSALRGVFRISNNLFYSDFAKKKYENLIESIKKHLPMIFLFSFFAASGYFLIGYLYVRLFLPNEYQTTIIYLFIMSLAIPAFIVQSLLRTAIDSDLRHKEVALFTIASSIFKILTILIFGFLFKIIGIICALTISTWLEFILYYLATINKELFINILNRHPLILKIVNKF